MKYQYICYRDPQTTYEKFIERHCLRARSKNPHKEKKELVEEAQHDWREIRRNDEEVQKFLVLQENECPFVR